MHVPTSTSQQLKTTPSSQSKSLSPFSPQLDAALASIIVKLEELYNQGKRTFVIVPHRDPDADAMAGCVGMDRLIRGVLPDNASVRWMHDGQLCASLREVCERPTEPISSLPGLVDESPHGTVAIIVVDQTGLHSPTVLPAEVGSNGLLETREADIILDHHGATRDEPGRLSAPEAGCTAALVYRLLELAQNHERFRRLTFCPEEEARFALLVNVGARTDASQNVSGPLSECVSPYVRWAVEKTEGCFDPAACRSFDVLAAHHDGLVRIAQAEAKVYPNVLINGVQAHLVVSYTGVAESVHCIGACADHLFSFEKKRYLHGDLPIAVVICGVIQLSSTDSEEVVHGGERIHVSVRTESPVDAEHIAELISASGGGRLGAAAAQLTVPEMFENMRVDEYMARLLAYLEMKIAKDKGPGLF
ncbi:MAG: hypothetical protein RL518_1279 [Pseudomonadota bacterium]|jgi:nanoRNase/pAp phosphatase (c-di-AMP/oligoRNAs hydrolase)